MKKMISLLSILVFVGTFAQAAEEHKAADAEGGSPAQHGIVSGHNTHNTEGPGHHGTNLFPKKKANPSESTRPAMVEYLEPQALASVPAGNVTLKWKEVSGADSYRVQIATDGNFKFLVSSTDFVKGNSFEATGLESGKNYFWRVFAWRSTNIAGYTSSYAKFSSFSVK